MNETEEKDLQHKKQTLPSEINQTQIIQQQNKQISEIEHGIQPNSQKINDDQSSMIQQQSSKKQTSDKKRTQQSKAQKNMIYYLKQLAKLNEIVITDISIRKGRTQKFINHISKLQNLKNSFTELKQKFKKQQIQSVYEKMAIVYYNLARLGQNQDSLQTAIQMLELSQSNKFLVIRWKMQLTAMKSSSNHKLSYKIGVQTMKLIIARLQQLKASLLGSKPKLSNFLSLVLKVITSQKRNDFIWIHNVQNNIKFFTDYIWHLQRQDSQSQNPNQPYKQDEQVNQNSNGIYSSYSSIKKLKPFFPGYDFQIADYMSLQKLEIDYIQKYNQLAQIKQVVKQLVIYASICCFTQATQNYYMGNYQLKYFHFKAIQIALLTVDKECTFVGFLLKILNDYYGTKMSQIRQQNSQIMQINELRRRMPRDKRQICMKNICFAQ